MRHSIRLANENGFTMIELIVVMIIVGIMAVTVIPRMSLLGGFSARGYADQIEAYLRFAQKSALAQRRIVLLDIPTDISMAPTLCVAPTYSASPSCPSNCTGMTPMALPGQFKAPTGTSWPVGWTGGLVCFDAMGKPVPSSPTINLYVYEQGVTGTPARTVTIESETGYVHSN